MSSSDPVSQGTPDSLSVSTIDIRLASDSRKTIKSILVNLSKNGESLRNVQKTVRAGGVHQEVFNPPFALDPEDHILVSVKCSWLSPWERVADIPIEINLRDIECMRIEQGIRLYRKKVKKVEVVVAAHQLGHQPLLATTTSIIDSCERFRLLIIGNSGVGKSSLIHRVFGVEGVRTSETARGIADIEREFISPTNERFVVHDSLGFEAGDERHMNIVKEFVSRRNAMPQLKDQLHAIWLCLETPYAGGRLLEGGAEEFLQRRKEFLGEIPLVVVLTKVDQLDTQLELDQPAKENFEQDKSRYLNKYCIDPLHRAAGSNITHVAVSAYEGYSESLSKLVTATLKNMAKYYVDEAPRFVASIAQRISIREKIDLSIAVGKKKYWNTLLKSAVFRGHTLQECLQVIRNDIINVWNFHDPDQCLMGDNINEALLRTDNLGNTSEALPDISPFANLIASGFESLQRPLGSDIPTVGVAIATVQVIYQAYKARPFSDGDVKIFMAYIVDLICVMQAIFLLSSGSRVSAGTVDFGLQGYEKTRKFVHLIVDAFDGKPGRDHVLDKIEELIWRFSIGDQEIEELRRKIGKVLSSSSS